MYVPVIIRVRFQIGPGPSSLLTTWGGNRYDLYILHELSVACTVFKRRARDLVSIGGAPGTKRTEKIKHGQSAHFNISFRLVVVCIMYQVRPSIFESFKGF